MMLIGQLLEANKQYAEDIRVLTQELRQYATTVIAAAKTLEMIERTVGALDRVVRVGNGDESLVAKVNSNVKRLSEFENRLVMHANSVSKALTDAAALGTSLTVMSTNLTALSDKADAIEGDVGEIDKRVVTHDNNLLHSTGAFSSLWWICNAVGWAVATGVALYAAFKDK